MNTVKVNYDELGYTPREIQQKRRTKVCYIAQKLIGLLMIVIGCAIPFMTGFDGDGTASLLFIFIGAVLIATRERIIRLW